MSRNTNPCGNEMMHSPRTDCLVAESTRHVVLSFTRTSNPCNRTLWLVEHMESAWSLPSPHDAHGIGHPSYSKGVAPFLPWGQDRERDDHLPACLDCTICAEIIHGAHIRATSILEDREHAIGARERGQVLTGVNRSYSRSKAEPHCRSSPWRERERGGPHRGKAADRRCTFSACPRRGEFCLVIACSSKAADDGGEELHRAARALRVCEIAVRDDCGERRTVVERFSFEIDVIFPREVMEELP